ncbi:MAG: Lrp/AsnC ligand binding domain-containing protein [Candidatus Marinimicrobia bacterium]|nr:Lrp/AsnC ligand binding domain-containing protein [Candidatus Neomarinimicrobiota bacterium]MCF7827870.1 Lrp/AsnC ligand binding domain-containing protein [Candidatus Neomarinimicrobiota bacterium]MCF7879375.1 Lrp/AsnC ligand binding domain-containing protein [Candidatus Neomarinimicrobiota bacterium]
MVTAIILVNCDGPEINSVAQNLADLEEISEVYSVAGRYDLVAICRVDENEKLANLVTNTLSGFEGVESTETLTAFRVFSRHDLERMFAIGMEE